MRKVFSSESKIKICYIKLIFFINCVLPVVANAQAGQWTWMNGSDFFGSSATYGTKGVFSSSNEPDGLYEPCQWTDTSGNFWLFGGTNSYTLVNGDLWEYNPAINQWAWINGTGVANSPGSYGIRGVPSPTNVPPARSLGMATWTDKSNNLWFFGGGNSNTGLYNDLWKYDITNNEWTWMKGPDTINNAGHYGTLGVPDTANNPPFLSETSATWVDSSGDLWFFGGENSMGVYNHLWRYNIASNTWTWMKGSNFTNRPSVFGTKEIESPANTPGGRGVYAHAKDNQGNYWLFGGFNTGGLLNDIWRYNPATNNWAWLGGSKVLNGKAVYGTQCAADSNNIPGARFENRACWTDKNANLWFFGGFRTSVAVHDVSNELWKYCISSNEWTFVSGDTILDPNGSWGTIGVSSPTNKPDGRGGSVSWIDKSFGNLYLFGGSTQGFPNSYNDLWRFAIDTNCAVCAAATPPATSFQTSDSSICADDCVNITDFTTGATTWLWSFPGGMPSSSTLQNPGQVCYFNTGNYDVTLIATNFQGSNTINCHNCVTVNPAPPTPTINVLHGDTLYFNTDTSFATYQWYNDTAQIPGGTDTLIVVSQSGNYNVKIISKGGCLIAVGIDYVGIKEFAVDGLQFTVSPNPAADKLTITGNWKPEAGNWKLGIYNILGEMMYSEKSEIQNPKSEIDLNVSSLSSGIYFLQISNDKGSWTGRFVKE